MAKKKKKKRPGGPRRPGQPPKRPDAAGAAAASAAGAAAAEDRRAAGQDRKQAAEQRRRAAKRRRQVRRIVIGSLIVVAIAAILYGRYYLNQRGAQAYARLSSAAGCGEVREFGDLSRDHWEMGQPVPEYEMEPPVGGAHSENVLPAGIYPEPLPTDIQQPQSIYQAVHSLEHGYIGIWHEGLDEDELSAIEREVRGESEVFVVPYPDLPRGQNLALTAWGRLQYCSEADPDVVSAFVERFRNKTAPEAAAR